MKQNMFLWQLGGFSFVALMGTVLHFLFDWTNESLLVAPFSGVNESTWEHMKLLFFPCFIFALIQRAFFKENKNFWCVKLRGIFQGLILIPVLFYTYNGAFGKSPDWLNILIFFICEAFVFSFEYKNFKKNDLKFALPRLSLALLIFLGALFVVFTFLPPSLPLFRSPNGGTYGIP